MKPKQLPEVPKTTKMQLLVTLLLVVVLGSIVYLYIYFGMRQAQHLNAVPTEVPVDSSPEVISDYISLEARQAVLDSMVNTTTTEGITLEQRTEALEELLSSASTSAPSALSDAEFEKKIMDLVEFSSQPPLQVEI